jgi:ankyrin repeat protein
MHASRDRMQYVRLLLESGSDVNNRDARNHTSLMNVMWRSWTDGEDVCDEDMDISKLIIQVNHQSFTNEHRQLWMARTRLPMLLIMKMSYATFKIV